MIKGANAEPLREQPAAGLEPQAYSDDAVLIVNMDDRSILACNAAAGRLFGGDPQDLIGLTTRNLHADSATFETCGRDLDQGKGGGTIACRRITFKRLDGTLFNAECDCIRMACGALGNVVVAVFRSVTADTRAYDSALTPPSAEMGALRAVIEQLAREFGWDYAELWQPSPDGGLRLTLDWTNIPEATRPLTDLSYLIRFSYGEWMPGGIWITGRHEWLSDIARVTHPSFRRKFVVNSAGLRTCFGLSVGSGLPASAVALFFARQPRLEDSAVVAAMIERLAAVNPPQPDHRMAERGDIGRFAVDHIRAADDNVTALSPRENDVLRHILAGRTNKETALELGISHRTVETYRAAIMRKLDVTTFAELVLRYGVMAATARRRAGTSPP